MKISQLNLENSSYWDKVCSNSSEAWFWHTYTWLNYQKVYRPNHFIEDLSFIVFENEKAPIAICPLFLEKNSSENNTSLEFSFGGGPLPQPAIVDGFSKNNEEKIRKEIFLKIDELAMQKKISRASMRLSPQCKPEFNSLLKFGYLDISLNTQILLTNSSIDFLKKEVRKGHLSDIKKGLDQLTIEVHYGPKTTKELFNEYKAMHALAAGRVTRSDETFEIMYNMILNQQAVLLTAKKSGLFVGFSLVILYKKAAYYGSAANSPDPQYTDLPISHTLQWTAIQWLRNQGIEFYELGWQQFGALLHDIPSEKQINLSRFKRGFGGKTFPLFTSEKYYSKEFFKNEMNKRTEVFLNSNHFRST